MNSRVYEGIVSHARTRPRTNAFRYGIYYVYVDLAELDDLDRTLSRFGHNRKAFVSVHDSDHGARDGSALRPWIGSVLSSAGIDLEGGAVRLLTFPRVRGFRFYPVSFWYCFHADGTCRAVLAEVQNTYRDHHSYLLHKGGRALDFAVDRFEHDKAFFVSPFVGPVARYRFTLSDPGEHLSVLIEDMVDGSMLLSASFVVNALPMTDDSLSRVVRALGPISARALVLIHWQAVKLLLKRVGIYPHTPPPQQEVSL